MRKQMQVDNAASINAIVISEMQRIAEEHHKNLVPLSDTTALSSCGLDSLCFAVLVARLEDRFGVDPFSASEDGAFPATLGEFVRMYERAAK
jgi:acyl carrier protein